MGPLPSEAFGPLPVGFLRVKITSANTPPMTSRQHRPPRPTPQPPPEPPE
ncbi:MAG: hypothetical protein M5U28_55545 [Sandaracinaceae bacterium]|nr:hypothetical protein [Sandaracinaceae bacterium]